MSYYKRYNYNYIKSFVNVIRGYCTGGMYLEDDESMNTFRLHIQLEKSRYWFLTVSVNKTSHLIDFSLDEEAADDSHYDFVDEESIRNAIYEEGDENLYLHEVFIKYLKTHTGGQLLEAIKPYITNEFHYY